MASRIPLVIAGGRFQQQQAADTLAVPGPLSTPSYYEVGEIATPATPAAGFGRIYAKTDNKLYFLNDLGTEVDLSASTPAGSTGAVQFNSAGAFGADSANFFWDDTNNRLGIGTAAPARTLSVTGGSGSARGILNAQYSSDAVGVASFLRKSRGTESVPTIVVTGDLVAFEGFEAYDGAAYRTTGGIASRAQGTIAAGSIPQEITIWLDDVGTGAPFSSTAQRITAKMTEVVINEPGNDVDFRVEGDTDVNLIFGDASTDFVGIGTATPGNKLHVVGDGRFTTNLQVDGNTTLGDAAGDTLTINGSAVSIPNNLNFDSNTLFIDSTNNRVGIGTAAPSQPLHVAGNSRLAGDVVVTGNLTVEGTTTTVDSETVLIADNHLYLNNGYTTVAAQTGGLVVNYLPTATTTTVNAAYVAGVAAVSNPTVGTTAAAAFAVNDLIQISNSTNNDGLYEVLSNAANVLTIRGIGVTGTVEDFTQNQFVAGASDGATITKVNVSIMRSGTDGLWEVGAGAVTPIVFTDLGTGSGTVTGTGANNQVAVWSGTSSLDGGATFTWDSATQAFAVDGSAVFNDGGGNFDHRIEGDTDANLFFVDASTDFIGIGTATPAQKLDVVGNVRSSGFYEVAEIATPATPGSGFGRIYAKTDNLPYFLNDAGTEYPLTSDVIATQTTTGLADGDFGYVSATNTWSKARNDGTSTQATVIAANEGTASQMALPGSVIENAKFTTVGGSPAVGSTVWLAADADDGATGSGKLTATAPTASGSYLVLCGVCVDASNYAGSKTAKIIFSPAAPVLL